MKRKEISQQLKQDICHLVNIARSYAPNQQVQDEITVAENCIYAGLGDYELACREESLDRIEAFLNPENKEEE
jgi:hypothetical protein